jgi:DNA-binding transcriptional ArsR family regulator
MMEAGQAVEVLAALAQSSRLAIVRLLVRAGPDGLAAGVIAENIGITPSNLTFHMATLERAGLVVATRDGRRIRYTCQFELIEGLAAFLLEDCCRGLENRD